MQTKFFMRLLRFIYSLHFTCLLNLVPLWVKQWTLSSKVLAKTYNDDLLQKFFLFFTGLRKSPIKHTNVLLFICCVLNETFKLQTKIVDFFHCFELDFICCAKFFHSLIDIIERFFIDKVEIITEHLRIRDEFTPWTQPLSSFFLNLVHHCFSLNSQLLLSNNKFLRLIIIILIFFLSIFFIISYCMLLLLCIYLRHRHACNYHNCIWK